MRDEGVKVTEVANVGALSPCTQIGDVHMAEALVRSEEGCCGELVQAHKQVHISEAWVAAAYMEELVNDKLLEDKTTSTSRILTIIKVLNEDLRPVIGQQERMISRANVWNWPVTYDKLGVRYRLRRHAVENELIKYPSAT
ncbi:chlorophyll a oxygenase [Corchorus olitorius]|uniref:Chlorophyll a oxygenase n=1 Tax=Corchorus olitorius TaxID=93759 RepID=A0A1R3JFK6_9ROSI|nr:chlorophyll a oxygenase [Corchorus olitorius]